MDKKFYLERFFWSLLEILLLDKLEKAVVMKCLKNKTSIVETIIINSIVYYKLKYSLQLKKSHIKHTLIQWKIQMIISENSLAWCFVLKEAKLLKESI